MKKRTLIAGAAEVSRLVLITGAAGGIGRATVELFCEQGWDVIGVDLKKPQVGGPEKAFYVADIKAAEEIERICESIKQEYGRLDALVNGAALQICHSARETSTQDWDDVMDVNVRASFLFSKLTFPLLAASKGSIVNISSVHALSTSENIAAYATSKGALLALTRALAIEFATSVRVNALLPGAVDTPMLRDGFNRRGAGKASAARKILEERTVMKRICQPIEIAHAILFLVAGEGAKFITGQGLVVDGGATIRLSTE